MKCLLLVAGYATRLYPLTKDRPKSLLPVGGKTILERLIDKIDQVPRINELFWYPTRGSPISSAPI